MLHLPPRKANVVKAQAAVEDAKSQSRSPRDSWSPRASDSKEDVETAQTTFKSAAADRTLSSPSSSAAEENVKVAQAELKVAKTQVAANQAQVKQSGRRAPGGEIDLDHTKINAPVDGVVVARNVDVGQTVAASLAAPTLFQIAQDLTKMQVDTNVSEADVGRVRVGQPATFTVDAYPGPRIQGSW